MRLCAISSTQSTKHAAVPPWTPPEELAKACHVSSREQYDEMYKRSIEDPEGFWGDIANEFHWEKKVCAVQAAQSYM